ncbi:MAG: histidine kinase [Muribaculaceae bacterium]|nr:histidine kinase [Muribaculaceae bacterium]
MNKQSNTYTLLMQIAVFVGLMLLPSLMICTFTRDLSSASAALSGMFVPLGITFIFFMVNYWWLVPKLYYRGRRGLYFLMNILMCVIVLSAEGLKIWMTTDIPWPKQNGVVFIVVVMASFISVMFFSGAAALAMALRNAARARALKEQMEEEKRRHTEAELVWLKNQLNPHFLFNTLNNISSLVVFDAERAQESISRLSDLLRYAMYESAKPTVSLLMEVDFMKDYISLMSLRCNDRTTVSTHFEVASPSIQIAPLLLVSLIENAFKHGVSASRHSEISISLIEDGGVLTFMCTNTDHAKGADDNSGSGIGLVNMRRRLELLYNDRYEWVQTSDDNRFNITIKIRL